MASRPASVALAFALALAARPASALDPAKAITQYARGAWSVEDGLPQSSVLSIAQSRDGFVWMATEDGLVRFDGARFTVYDARSVEALARSAIRVVVEDADGAVWGGTRGVGLLRVRAGRADVPVPGAAFDGADVTALARARSGGLWAGTDRGGVFRVEGASARRVADVGAQVKGLVEDADGAIWIGSAKGLSRARGGAVEPVVEGVPEGGVGCVVPAPGGGVRAGWTGAVCTLGPGRGATCVGADAGLPPALVNAIHEDRDRNLWIGSQEGGLSRVRDGRATSIGEKDGLASSSVRAIVEDREGGLWVGLQGGGVARLRDGLVTPIGPAEGLCAEILWSVTEDARGVLWAGTHGGGVCRLEGGAGRAVRAKDGLPSDIVFAVAPAAGGGVWAGTQNGLARVRDAGVEAAPIEDLARPIVSVLEDARGRVFAGSLGGGMAVREPGGAFRVLRAQDGLPSEFVTGFLDDGRGGVLVATRKGLVRWVDGRLEGARGAADGLADANVSSMAIDDRGTLWVSTLAGLARERAGRFVVYTTKHGLPQDAILRMIDDGRGALWMTASKGAFRVDKRDLDAIDAGAIARLSPLVVGRAEGMRHAECNGGTQNAGVRLRDGRLAFPTLRGLATIDPARLPRNAVPPPVAIESVVVGGVEEVPGDVVVVPPDRRRLEVHVGGLSFNAPTRVAFRFKLDGFDRDFIDAGARRTAYYAGLGPGEYVFRAIAANEDGVWSDAGASLRVKITPRFHETTPFFFLCAGAVGLVAFGGYRARMRQLRARAAELERLVALRTKELADEKEVSERLLLNVLPAPIAERLKRGEPKIADSFDAVTVAFADLVGFTQLSARMSAEDLVKLLNEIFSAFDRLSARHGLEKIKTIGDAYMVVGGLPVARDDHAPAVVDMAIEMLEAIERINAEHGTSLAVRVGVNTGPVVAGVIGERKFIYDLWGDAVNTASRMESHGVPGAVHVTESTRDALGDAHVVEERGVIQVKGKGEMRTFFVRARAAR